MTFRGPGQPAPPGKKPAPLAPKASEFIKYVESFNHSLRVLTRDLSARYPSDPMIYRAEKRIMSVIGIDPVFVIKTVGPFLYGYRKEIYALEDTTNPDAEDFFFKNTFESDFKGGVDQDSVEIAMYILPKVKESARTLDAPSRQEYKRLVIDLLDDYIEFRAATAGAAATGK